VGDVRDCVNTLQSMSAGEERKLSARELDYAKQLAREALDLVRTLTELLGKQCEEVDDIENINMDDAIDKMQEAAYE
jgi:hypothetical protein